MALYEAESKLKEVNNHIDKLLKERENVIKEWYIVFITENQNEITCIAEGKGESMNVFDFYLINGDSKMLACYIYGDYRECSIYDFYKHIDDTMLLLNAANGRGIEVPELHRNLVHAKAMEIRERAREAANLKSKDVVMQEPLK